MHRSSGAPEATAEATTMLKALRIAGMVHSVTLSFMAPGIAQSSATVLAHGTSTVDSAAGIFGLAVVIALLLRVSHHLRMGPEAAAFESWVDGARDDRLGSMLVRFYAVEDLVCAVLMAATAGTRPSEAASCSAVSGLCLVLSMAHLAYLLFVRPYRGKLDAFFAKLIAVLMCTLSVLSVAARSSQDQSAELFAYISLVLLAMFPVQAVVLFAVYYAHRAKRDALNAGTLSAPALDVQLTTTTATSTTRTNPLHHNATL